LFVRFSFSKASFRAATVKQFPAKDAFASHAVGIFHEKRQAGALQPSMECSRCVSESRWDAGYTHTVRAIAQAPRTHAFDPLEGLILHEVESGQLTAER
jgi:hypothetical protein